MIRFDEKLTSLVDMLLEKTRKGKISWDATAGNDVFITLFGRYGVSITYENAAYHLMFVQDNGEAIDTKVEHSVDSTNHWKLEELFILAQRSANNAEEKLDGLLQELQRI